MSGTWTQLRLSLWKHWILRRRQPFTSVLQLFFPTLLLLILLLVQFAIPPSQFETCQFKARALPSTGMLPLVQTFACNIQNNCGLLRDFQDVPQYPNNKMDSIVDNLEPILYNETVHKFNAEVPKAFRLLNSTALAINNTIMQKAISGNVHLADFLLDKEAVGNILVDNGIEEKATVVLLDTLLRMGMVTGDLGSVDLPDITTCNTTSLRLLFPQSNKLMLNKMETIFCKLSQDNLKNLLGGGAQGNINVNIFISYYNAASSGITEQLNSTMKIVSTGIKMMESLRSTASRLMNRKKRAILDDLGFGNFTEVFNDLMEFDMGQVSCMMTNLADSTVFQVANNCNISVDLIETVFDTMKPSLPIWLNVSEVFNITNGAADSMSTCKVDVNRVVYLSNRTTSTYPKDFFSCPNNISVEDFLLEQWRTFSYHNFSTKLEDWRRNEFFNTDWTNMTMTSVLDTATTVTELISQMEGLSLLGLGDTLDLNTTIALFITSPSVTAVMESVTDLMEEMNIYMRNNDQWEEFKADIMQIVELRNKMTEQIPAVYMKDLFLNQEAFAILLANLSSNSVNTTNSIMEEQISLDLFTIMAVQFETFIDNFCSKALFSRYLKLSSNPAPLNVTLESIGDQLCQHQDILPFIVNYLKFDDIFDYLSAAYELSPSQLASKSNLTMEEFKQLEEIMAEMNSIYPELNSQIESFLEDVNITSLEAQLNVTSLKGEHMTQIVGHFMCGIPLKRIESKPYKPLNNFSDNGTNDSSSIVHGPEDGCKIIENLFGNENYGRIIWGILKNILRGDVLYSPVNSATQEIVNKSSIFFEKISIFRGNVRSFGDLFLTLKDITAYKAHADLLTELFRSTFFEDITKSKLEDSLDMKNLINLNLTAVQNTTSENLFLFQTLNKFGRALDCINTDRFKGVENEEQIISMTKNTSYPFLAGLIFEKSLDSNNKLASHAQYKIRMEIDKVPMTAQTKEKLWVPGPDGDFYYNLRYFWGFVQLQDLIDTSIIEIQTGKSAKGNVYLQQFPFPCFMRNNFLSGLYTAQLLPVALVFGFSVLVSTLVREFMWERESKNGQLLQIMGMESWIIWFSNFSLMTLILSINCILITIVLSAGKLLPLSDPFIIFLILFAYSFSLIMFIFLLYTIMRKSTSGSVLSFLYYILTFLPFLILISLNEDVSYGVIIIANVFMTTSFGFSLLYVTRYEQKQIGMNWNNIQISPIKDDNINVIFFLSMMIIDGILYGVVGFFIYKLSNIDGSWNSRKKKKYLKHDESPMAESQDTEGIILRNLTKTYKVGKSGQRLAVDSLSVHFRKNEITGLLGHNGAGKSTTMGMITGMIAPTSGGIVVDGVQFEDQLESYKNKIGFCPQYGILYDNLNTKEHLYMYASLKCKENNDVENNVNDLLSKMNLDDKVDTLCKHLSEGLKRRLAIAIAFAGNSSIIVLDEPTAGVDSAARRFIWDLILNCKEGRTIILSTHHMDEAEIMCDKIAIVHNGKLLIQGSTNEFQENYGNGLQLNISTGISSTVHTEVTSLNSSLNTLRPSSVTLQDNLDFQMKRIIPTLEKISQSSYRRIYNLPIEEEGNFSKCQELFAVLENEKESLDINSFSISSPSLEDIFIAVTWEADEKNAENFVLGKRSKWGKKKAGKINDITYDDKSLTSENSVNTLKSQEYQNISQTYAKIIYAVLLKRFYSLIRDIKSMLLSFCIPLLLLIFALVIAVFRPESDSPPLLLTPSLYGPNSVSFTSAESDNTILDSLLSPPGIGTTCMDSKPVQSFTPCSISTGANVTEVLKQTCECSSKNWKCGISKNESEIVNQLQKTTDLLYYLPDDIHPNDWILNTHFDFIEKRYGGWRLNTHGSFVYYNNKGFHSPASYLNALNNARLRSMLGNKTASKNYGISTTSHPFRRTPNQISGQSIIQHVSDYTLAFIMVAVVSFLPARTMIYLIQERINEEKMVQRTFGVTPLLYWSSAFLWDFVIALLFTLACTIVIVAFNLRSFAYSWNLLASALLILVYTITANNMVYLLEKLFREPSLGQVVMLTVSVFSGVACLMIMLLLYMYWWMPQLTVARGYLQYIFLLIPPYAVGGGFLELIQNQVSADLFDSIAHEDKYQPPLNWPIVGRNLVFLTVEACLFFFINLIWEIYTDSSVSKSNAQSDEKVLSLTNVSKTYKNFSREFKAVTDITFDILRAECYGLIGLNGAGKSTTFQMITGKTTNTTGNINLNLSRIGYCPQNNSLDPRISVKNLLEVYARMAGYDKLAADKVANRLIKEYMLDTYRNVLCCDLSGGNKRKVCSAISFIGNPELILMDEPTSGMDPKSRRVIWKNIKKIVNHGKSVLLTSHSLFECDSLCHNIGVMVNGSIKAAGSPDILREQYGKGYKLNLRMDPSADLERAHSFVVANFRDPKFIEERQNWVKYAVNGKLSELLGHISMAQTQKIIDRFSIDVTSLEDIFLHITNGSNPQFEPSRPQGNNGQPNVVVDNLADTKYMEKLVEQKPDAESNVPDEPANYSPPRTPYQT